MNPPATAYATRIAALHRELGLLADYALRRKLALQPEAEETALLAIAKPSDSPPVRLTAPAAAAWAELRQAAQADGIALEPLSGFRSVNRQVEIIRLKLAAGQPLAAILASVAAPGYSEHHTGHALDLGTPGEPALEEGFALTPAYAWLREHAAKHGFHLSYPRDNPHGIVFEPWHWCWRRG